jgi:hypothetical protein
MEKKNLHVYVLLYLSTFLTLVPPPHPTPVTYLHLPYSTFQSQQLQGNSPKGAATWPPPPPHLRPLLVGDANSRKMCDREMINGNRLTVDITCGDGPMKRLLGQPVKNHTFSRCMPQIITNSRSNSKHTMM